MNLKLFDQAINSLTLIERLAYLFFLFNTLAILSLVECFLLKE